MNSPIYPKDWPDIDQALYLRSVKLFSAVKNLLSVKMELYADTKVLQGDIFLFNHFSRFETFIPQFLIYEKTGAFSCAIASGEFFKEKNILSDYLQQVGVYPHDHPRLFAMLAGQILRGRKVVIFPEGGMVKDRRVIDKTGEYSIYSRMTGNRRKLHTGPAVLGQGVEAIKSAIRHAFKENRIERLLGWQEQLQFDNLNELLAAAHKPTLIVPANITFYPIRASENLLFKSIEMFSGGLSLRQSEELLIESNILIKDTDMDIRMGRPVNPCCVWDWRTHFIMNKVAPDIQKLDQVFKLRSEAKNWKERLLEHFFIENAQCARDQYMKEIYTNLTVNISHLASTFIMSMIGAKRRQIEKSRFYTVLYVAIKNLQKNTDIHLHRSLLNPDDYGGLPHGVSTRFDQFICFAKAAELIAEREGCYHFLPTLCEDYDFDRIRLENPIAVYNNEAAPLRTVREALLAADEESRTMNPYRLAAWQFEDEQLGLAFERQTYDGARHNGTMKQQETANADPSPFFIQPTEPNGFGALLIHGLLASPAELREYGRYLADQGYTVLGIRLKGHGTSPYALRDVSCEQWFDSVQRGFNILKIYCPRLFVIGFATGGALALKLAAEKHPEIIGLVAVSVSIKFVNPAFMLVPLLYNANVLVRWVSSLEGVKPFIENPPEHPDINYWNAPVRALYELRRLIHQLETLLPSIETPTLVMYADQDPVVSPQSAEIVFNKLGATHKKLRVIKSDRHGILMENIGNTWTMIDDFLIQYRQDHAVEVINPQF
ncbi:alpha/beta fold hydrolase [Methylomicrobium sp. Wu6]|uniref:alpha/beta hydrolase n=1 Tax=Methylomicrobium sp. Wu6 TaxID=3107928 RepID=UPI002DD660C5|nr:alpha/beta fold hydrolase [Methylomicrobium sp. Wu6]MEC4748166.1 alpha/beta fold hydrolase [Methylomicrobium sp. Wu6]